MSKTLWLILAWPCACLARAADKHARGLAAPAPPARTTATAWRHPVLAGMDRALFIQQMKDFKSAPGRHGDAQHARATATRRSSNSPAFLCPKTRDAIGRKEPSMNIDRRKFLLCASASGLLDSRRPPGLGAAQQLASAQAAAGLIVGAASAARPQPSICACGASAR